MNYCKTSKETYLEALHVEYMLRRSLRQQCRRKAHIEEEDFQQRLRAHTVERLFPREDNHTLVIRRLLNTNEKEEEEWRQAQKFHTRVRVKDR